MPVCSAASCTVCTLPESSSFLASTTFRRTSGTARSLTTKYFFFSDSFPISIILFLKSGYLIRLQNKEDGSSSTEKSPAGDVRLVKTHVFLRGICYHTCKDVSSLFSSGLFLRQGDPFQICVDKQIDISVHHRVHVSCLFICTVVFHHCIGLHYIGTDLVAPADIRNFAADTRKLLFRLLLFEKIELRLQHL